MLQALPGQGHPEAASQRAACGLTSFQQVLAVVQQVPAHPLTTPTLNTLPCRQSDAATSLPDSAAQSCSIPVWRPQHHDQAAHAPGAVHDQPAAECYHDAQVTCCSHGPASAAVLILQTDNPELHCRRLRTSRTAARMTLQRLRPCPWAPCTCQRRLPASLLAPHSARCPANMQAAASSGSKL